MQYTVMQIINANSLIPIEKRGDYVKLGGGKLNSNLIANIFIKSDFL